MKSNRINAAVFDVSLAGSRAAGFLGVMLSYGLIPKHHRDQATEIVEAHRSATSQLDSLLHLPVDSPEREIDELKVGDVVRPNAQYHASYPGEMSRDMEGTVEEFIANDYHAFVRWDDGRRVYFNVDLLERVQA